MGHEPWSPPEGLCDQSRSQRQLKSQTEREKKYDDNKAMRGDRDREREKWRLDGKRRRRRPVVLKASEPN